MRGLAPLVRRNREEATAVDRSGRIAYRTTKKKIHHSFPRIRLEITTRAAQLTLRETRSMLRFVGVNRSRNSRGGGGCGPCVVKRHKCCVLAEAVGRARVSVRASLSSRVRFVPFAFQKRRQQKKSYLDTHAYTLLAAEKGGSVRYSRRGMSQTAYL